ncbi:MAG: hypothetical protein HeimC3_32450 [Candidatus Heimdallarchaeota archaeon LC_3]|nr:MAG: hypothetical protein HeimC3_32450 [Candidatus Heimdallarchaeota archaeon LC_3]
MNLTDSRRYFTIFYFHLKSSYKAIILSSLGLILALSTISASIYYVDTKSDVLFEQEILNDNDFRPDTIRLISEASLADFQGDYISFNESFESITRFIIDRTKSHDQFSYANFHPVELFYNGLRVFALNDSISNNPIINNSISYQREDFAIVELNSDHLTMLSSNYSINTDLLVSSSDGLLFSFDNDFKKYINTTMFLHSFKNGSNDFTSSPANVTIKQVFEIDESIQSFWRQSLSILNRYDTVFFVNDLLETLKYFKILEDPLHFFKFPKVDYNYKIEITYPSFDTDLFQSLIDFSNELEDILRQAVIIEFKSKFSVDNLWITNHFRQDYSWNLHKTLDIERSMIVFAIPLLILILFVTNYFFNLFYKNIQNQVLFYQRKGASNKLAMLIEIVELAIIFFISVSVSIVVGVPLIFLGFLSDKYLEINFPDFPDLVIDFQNMFPTMLFTGFILILLIGLPRVYRISKHNFHDNHQIHEKQPFWKKHYIDIWIIAGSLFIIFISFLAAGENDLSVFVSLSYPFPLLLAVGLILFVTRAFPYSIQYLSTIFWSKSFKTFSLSLKNIVQDKSSFMRAFILLSFLSLLFTVYISYPYTQDASRANISTLNYGADLLMFNESINDNFYTEFKTNYSQQIKNSYQYTEIRNIEYFGNNLEYFDYGNDKILAFNTTSALEVYKTNFPRDKIGTTKNLEQSFQDLTIDDGIFRIILHKNVADLFGYNIGEYFKFRNQNNNETNFLVIDTFQYWPNFWGMNYGGDFLVGIMDLDFVEKNWSNFTSGGFGILQEGILVNFKNRSFNEQQKIIENIKTNNNSLEIYSVADSVADFRNEPENIALWSEIIYLEVILLIIMVLVMFTFLGLHTEELKSFLFLERTLGISKNEQTFILFFSSFILLFSALGFGLLLGFLVAFFYHNLSNLTLEGSINILIPFKVLMPLFGLILTTFSILLVFFTSKLNKTNLSEILKEFEH